MSYYPREEQETHISFTPGEGGWTICTTYPPHIRRVLAIAEIWRSHDDGTGRIISVDGFLDKNQVRLFKPLKEDSEDE